MFDLGSDNYGGDKKSGNADIVASPFEVKQQPNQCRDPIFAVLFYVNLAVIIGLAAAFGSNPFTDTTNANNNDNGDDAEAEMGTPSFAPFLYAAAAAGGAGVVFSCLALLVLMMIPGIMIKVSLIGNIIVCAVAALAAFAYGQVGMAILAAICLVLTCCWTYCIWSRIPFATANLKTGCTAVKANCGVTLLAYAVVVAALGWTMLWVTSIIGVQDSLISCQTINQEYAEENQLEYYEEGQTVCSNPNYLYFFLLFVSYFFTHQVLQNIIHTTIAGVIGTWWFVPQESGFCGKAVVGSFFRTMTTSFGSICFGSLIVAIIESTRQVVEMARQNEDIGNTVSCCIDCILGCVQSLVEYFNKWAYVYVGLYGYSYCEAGTNVMQLFRDRGWEAVIADDIIGTVLSLMALAVGLFSSFVAAFSANYSDWFDDMLNSDTLFQDKTYIIVFCAIIGFIMGFALCTIVMGVIASSVTATIVLFAEAPSEFETNYPELSLEMRDAYMSAHPGSI